MSRGWYLMHRGWMTSGDFKPEPFTEPMAYVWSIEMAAFEPHAQWFNGVRYPVERGQFVTSIRVMAKAFGWSVKRTISFGNRMEECGKWTRVEAQPGKHGPTLLTVENYARFQAIPKRTETPSELEGAQPVAQQGDTSGNTTELILTSGNELEPQEERAAPRAPAWPYQDAIDAWVQAAQLKGWKPNTRPKLTDGRRRKLAAIFKTYGFDGWVAGIQRAMDSAYLASARPPPWFNLSWFENINNFTKVFEGSYDEQFGKQSEQQHSGWLDARQQLSGSGAAGGAVPQLAGPLAAQDAISR